MSSRNAQNQRIEKYINMRSARRDQLDVKDILLLLFFLGFIVFMVWIHIYGHNKYKSEREEILDAGFTIRSEYGLGTNLWYVVDIDGNTEEGCAFEFTGHANETFLVQNHADSIARLGNVGYIDGRINVDSAEGFKSYATYKECME